MKLTYIQEESLRLIYQDKTFDDDDNRIHGSTKNALYNKGLIDPCAEKWACSILGEDYMNKL